MKVAKKARLNKAGWRFGTVAEFLELSEAEAAMVEMKLLLAENVRRRRLALHWTQAELAKRLHSSQSRIAKMEAADATVSFDLLIRALLTLGATQQNLAQLIGRKKKSPAA